VIIRVDSINTFFLIWKSQYNGITPWIRNEKLALIDCELVSNLDPHIDENNGIKRLIKKCRIVQVQSRQLPRVDEESKPARE